MTGGRDGNSSTDVESSEECLGKLTAVHINSVALESKQDLAVCSRGCQVQFVPAV